MTNLTNLTSHHHPPERAFPRAGLNWLAAIAATTVLVGGCGEDDAPPPPPVVRAPEPPPPPPPEPTVKSIAELMKELNIDPRVELPEERAPDTTEERVAVLLFWNAFAKGDSQYALTQMSSEDKRVLTGLKSTGSWDAATAKIEKIEVQCSDEGDGFATLGVITAGGSEQPLLWDATVSEADAATFTAFPGPSDILDHLSGEDWIEAWKKYVNGLFEKYANLPDEEIEIPQQDVQLAENDSAAPTPPADEGGGGGAGGGGAPMRKHPTGPPVRGPEGPSPGR
ncbi:MAG: hypothetical protein EXS03_02215 [Phycisphaerales bacterium]|nr:hypothetical protein [Phycisphaerales bacterium]